MLQVQRDIKLHSDGTILTLGHSQDLGGKIGDDWFLLDLPDPDIFTDNPRNLLPSLSHMSMLQKSVDKYGETEYIFCSVRFLWKL